MNRLAGFVTGFHEVTRDNKVLVFFLLGTLLLCCFRELRRHFLSRRTMPLALYAGAASVLVILPPTAWALSLYFTAYDSYAMFWSIVPVNLLIAFTGCTAFFAYEEKLRSLSLPMRAALLLLLTAAVLLCGDCGQGLWRRDAAPKEEPDPVKELRSRYPEGTYLLAPDDIQAAVRIYAPEFQTLYGRDLWDPSLQGYTYDKYSEEIALCRDALTDFRYYARLSDAEKVLQTAADTGVRTVLLPGNEESRPEELSKAADRYGFTYEDLRTEGGHYFLFERP